MLLDRGGADRDLLVAGFERVLRNIYSPQEYYRRSLDCISRFHADRIEPRQSSLLADVRALIRMLTTLGVRDRARWTFWKYCFDLVRLYPRDIPHGLTLAAMGYHFRQITDKYCSPVKELA